MGIPVKKLRGITDAIATALVGEGLGDSEAFLAAAKTPAGRKGLAAKCDAGDRDILELANRADLARIKGVAGVFGDLLEAAGVDTVKELRNRRPDNLHAKIVETNSDKSIAGRNPTPSDVESWVTQAKELVPAIEY